ncbi:ethylene-responsive element binding protein1 [Artemisia annua]|uniref:Ethylene-responsive element binding protein1 n=1 Tax=Artemisia annua TaxID=35608 RepID=A0A2U1KF45_ARTAN|nr:ethylene-responsive element binding protein1 [Artemisia annua]
MMRNNGFDSDFALLESISRHLLDDTAPTMSCRSSNFLFPHLSETWGELPLQQNDSEDMLIATFLSEALDFQLPPLPEMTSSARITWSAKGINSGEPEPVRITSKRKMTSPSEGLLVKKVKVES